MNHADIVFETKIDAYHWAHIMCDHFYKTWLGIDAIAAGFISERRATRIGTAKLVAEVDL